MHQDEKYYQVGRPRLIWAFAGPTGHYKPRLPQNSATHLINIDRACYYPYTELDGPAAHLVHDKNKGVALDLPSQSGRLCVADQDGPFNMLGHLKGSGNP
jgi:hypothetical protein